ncbi:MAG: biopolymer transporter ExbD [Candidatus Accumulibacter sp.]|jgi:biopolymer transport protein ExbD|nr:biopolymer transporter ExbD [Accumulibacter sp.]
MAFGSFNSGTARPMAEINTTPLVDVMLVLLIIFLVTAPLMTQAIKVDLPQASAEAAETTPETIRLSLDARGALFWNDAAMGAAETADTLATLETRLQTAVQGGTPLEVQLSADRDTRYQRVAEIMSIVKRAGVAKLGFVTLPNE